MNKVSSSPLPPETGQYRSLQILDELANNDAITQRELSSRLGIALGLVNSYLKNLVAKGYITVRNIPPKRYAYYLTPKGFAEKTRLAYDLLQDYTRIYREAKSNYRRLFNELEQEGIKKVLFAGADEVAEFAYITLQETGLELTGVVDREERNDRFFGNVVRPLTDIGKMEYDVIVIACYVHRQSIQEELKKYEPDERKIKLVFAME